MTQLCLFIFSFSGLLCVCVCKPREYILIKQLMTWPNAQSYCRLYHNDLATIQTDEDLINLRQTAKENAFTLYGWIGLYNDIQSWRWSYQEENLNFTRFYPGQPDNIGSGEECMVLRFDGYWADIYCTYIRHFLCFEEKNGTVTYYLVKIYKTWSEAQNHCRNLYTDLVTIRNGTVNEELRVLMYWSTEVWIGLFRETWKWSDGSNLSAINEKSAQNLNGGNENCVSATYYGYFEDFLCTIALNFYCTTVKLNRQIVKVQVKLNTDDVDDAQLQMLVMNKLNLTLSGLTEDEDFNMTWRKQKNGEVFQEIINLPISANGSSECFVGPY